MADHPPIAMRPGVFDVEEVLPELEAARKIHGPDYGRAIKSDKSATPYRPLANYDWREDLRHK